MFVSKKKTHEIRSENKTKEHTSTRALKYNKSIRSPSRRKGIQKRKSFIIASEDFEKITLYTLIVNTSVRL